MNAAIAAVELAPDDKVKLRTALRREVEQLEPRELERA